MACTIDSYAGSRNTDRTRGFRGVIGTAKRYIGINIFSRLGARGTEGWEPTTRVVVNVNGDERRDEDECVSIEDRGDEGTIVVKDGTEEGGTVREREKGTETCGSGKTWKVCFRGEEDRPKKGEG